MRLSPSWNKPASPDDSHVLLARSVQEGGQAASPERDDAHTPGKRRTGERLDWMVIRTGISHLQSFAEYMQAGLVAEVASIATEQVYVSRARPSQRQDPT